MVTVSITSDVSSPSLGLQTHPPLSEPNFALPTKVRKSISITISLQISAGIVEL